MKTELAMVAGEELDRAVCNAVGVDWGASFPSKDIAGAMACLNGIMQRNGMTSWLVVRRNEYICQLFGHPESINPGPTKPNPQPTQCLAICEAILLAKEARMLRSQDAQEF